MEQAFRAFRYYTATIGRMAGAGNASVKVFRTLLRPTVSRWFVVDLKLQKEKKRSFRYTFFLPGPKGPLK